MNVTMEIDGASFGAGLLTGSMLALMIAIFVFCAFKDGKVVELEDDPSIMRI